MWDHGMNHLGEYPVVAADSRALGLSSEHGHWKTVISPDLGFSIAGEATNLQT